MSDKKNYREASLRRNNTRYPNFPPVQEMNQSKQKNVMEIVSVKSLKAKDAGTKIWIRGRLHTSRAKGKKISFFLVQEN